jgi:hypothetical protein
MIRIEQSAKARGRSCLAAADFVSPGSVACRCYFAVILLFSRCYAAVFPLLSFRRLLLFSNELTSFDRGVPLGTAGQTAPRPLSERPGTGGGVKLECDP